MKNKFIKIFGSIVLVVLIIVYLFTASFFISSYAPTTEALSNLEDSNLVDVTNDGLITFTPKNTVPTTGLIIYPGAKVKAEAYSTLANKIAQAGYEIIITTMPLNFAIFNSDAADKAILMFPNIKNWAIAVHSLGGVMSTKYASEHNNIDGVIFYASYPQNDALKNSDLEVTSIYVSLDGVEDLQKYQIQKTFYQFLLIK